ncbi:MAG: GrdX family protein [Treponema sp.]|nr:GrdX family protein [Treponema sp.]
MPRLDRDIHCQRTTWRARRGTHFSTPSGTRALPPTARARYNRPRERAKGASIIAITNNPLARERARGLAVEFVDADFAAVLRAARDKIHLGHALLTHPLSGSVKPGQTPYKTALVSAERGALDLDGLHIIEESILACERARPCALPAENVLADFQEIDYNLVFSGREGERR